ncbi:MAG TPA: hypothetical protein VKD23_05570 [Terriglobales bacterium]|nr:hypothetical protein [Terriglobales bacterium]
MNRKSRSKRSSPGHGGKRPGAGRKRTGTIGLHLRVSPETLSQIVGLINYYPYLTRSAVVTEAIAEKYGRWQQANEELRVQAQRNQERREQERIQQMGQELRDAEPLFPKWKSHRRLENLRDLASYYARSTNLDEKNKQWALAFHQKINERITEVTGAS